MPGLMHRISAPRMSKSKCESRSAGRHKRGGAPVPVTVGLLRDKTRKPGRAPLSAKVVAKVLDLTCSEPPGQATHWTGRAMAKAVGVSLRAVQRLWEAHRLQPHPIRTFKRSNDPEFAEKVEDIVGLYMDPPKHAVVVSIDEKRSHGGG